MKCYNRNWEWNRDASLEDWKAERRIVINMKNKKTARFLSVLVMISAAAVFSACGEKSGGKVESGGQTVDGSVQSVSYELLRAADEEPDFTPEESRIPEGAGIQEKSGTAKETGATDELTCDEMLRRFYEQHYDGWSQEDIEQAVNSRSPYYKKSSYYEEITEYWEEVREVRDTANVMEPLYFTDMKYYEEADFQGVSRAVLRLARNEIYARRGYIFKDEDLYNYFMGCIWYQPVSNCRNAGKAEEFDDSVFNEYEKKNLELLAGLESR